MLSNLMQTLFRRGRPVKERRRPVEAGPCPNVGARICRRNVAMTVDSPLQQDLWDWLVLMGWREANAAPERRTYKRLPEEAMARLVQADRAEREGVYRELIGGA